MKAEVNTVERPPQVRKESIFTRRDCVTDTGENQTQSFLFLSEEGLVFNIHKSRSEQFSM